MSRVAELEQRVATLEEKVAKLLGERVARSGDRQQPTLPPGSGVALRTARMLAGWRSIDVAKAVRLSPGYMCDYEREFRLIPLHRAKQIYTLFIDNRQTPPVWEGVR